MFSDTVPATFHARAPGIVIGSTIMVAVIAALVSAKTLPFTFGALMIVVLGSGVLRGKMRDALSAPAGTLLFLAPFPLYAILTSAWAFSPAMALVVTVFSFLIIVASFVMMRLVMAEQRLALLHMAEGLWLGLLLGALYLMTELATEQGIKLWIYNLLALQPGDLKPPTFFRWSDGKLIDISRQDLTRNIAPLALLSWPALAAVVGGVPRRYAGILAVTLAIVSTITVMSSWHETSKLALLVGALVFLCAKLAPAFSVKAALAGWLILCVGILPAALIGPRLGLDEASWLPASARHRIIIWNETASHTLKSPIFGVGARTTYFLGPDLEKEIPDEQRVELMRSLSSHAHNAFMQTWFELGAVGILLLCLFGVGITRAIGKLQRRPMPYALATFAAATTMAASSYGLFQYWFQAMFGLTAVCCCIGVALLSMRDDRQSNETV